MRHLLTSSVQVLIFFALLGIQTNGWAAGDWLDASVGDSHSIALKSDGRVFASGLNSSGQLGDGTTTQSKLFKQVATGASDVAAYGNVSYILKTDGTVWKTTAAGAWTQTMAGVTKLQEHIGGVNAIKADSTIWDASAGTQIMVSSAAVKAYASNNGGAEASPCAANSVVNSTLGVPLSGVLGSLTGVVETAIGDYYTGIICNYGSAVQIYNGGKLALKSDGSLWVSGSNSQGVLGTGSTATVSSWTQVLTGVAHIQAIGPTAFASMTDGRILAAGTNTNSQMGDGTTSQKLSWTQVASGVSKSTLGSNHSIIVKSDGTLWVSGNNASAQHALNDTANRTAWTQTGVIGTLSVTKGVHSNKIALTWDNGDGLTGSSFEVWRSVGKYGTKTLLTMSTALSYDDTSVVEGQVYGYYIKFANGVTTDPDYGYLAPPAFSSIQTGNYVDASVGSSHTIALKSDGRAFASGDNSGGQLGDGTTTPSKLFKQIATGVTDVAAFGTVSYILKTDGTVWKSTAAGAWTQTMAGVTKLQEHLGGVNAIKSDSTIWDASAGTQIMVSSAAVKAYASNNGGGEASPCAANSVVNNTLGVPLSGVLGSLTGVLETAIGDYYTGVICNYGSAVQIYNGGKFALKSDGSLWVSGSNSQGVLGIGSTASPPTSTGWTQSLDNLSRIQAIATATFALQNDGSLWASGNNGNGVFGVGNTTATTTFKRIASGVVRGVVGNNHSVIVKSDGTLWVSGNNASAQFGLNDTANRTTWTQTGIMGVLSVTKGVHSNKIALAWDNGDGLTGSSFEVWRSVGKYGAKALLTTTSAMSYDDTSVVEGQVYGYYIRFTNGVTSDPDYGYLKTPTFSSSLSGNYIDASVGDSHTLVLKGDGRVFASGLNSSGQLGDGTTTQSKLFKQITTGVSDVAAYGNVSYILKTDGTVWKTTAAGAWTQTMAAVTKLQEHIGGVNAIKADSTIWDASVGTQIMVSSAAVKAYASNNGGGEASPCAANSVVNNTLGVPLSGVLGSLTGVFETAIGDYYTGVICNYGSAVQIYNGGRLALKSDGSLWVSGSNSQGVLGIGSTASPPTSTGWTQSLDNLSRIQANATATFALQNDGSLWASGNNGNGVFGVGNTTATTTFKRVASGVVRGVVGNNHSVIVKSDGTLWVSGNNASAQHGLNDTTNRTAWTQTGFITPGKVTGVNATDGTLYAKVNVSWTADVDAVNYDIFRSTAAGTKGSSIVTNITGTHYDDMAVSGSTHYFYIVVAKNPVGSGPDSNQDEGYGKIPAVLSNLTATQGTQNGKVQLGWTSNPDATGYEVWRSTAAGGTATKIATLMAMPASSYEDTAVSSVNSYFYTIKTMVGSLTSAASNEAEGWANGTPTLASAALTASSTAPSAATSATITDPNVTAGKTESYTLAITTPPSTGTLAIVGGKFVYTPPPDGLYSGSLPFDFTVTDKGGAVYAATGTINVVCGSPTISAFTLLLTSVTQATTFQANATYSLPVCSANGQIKMDVLDGNSVVVVAGNAEGTSNGSGLTHTFTSAGVMTAGSYTVRMTATSDSGTATKTAVLTVKSVNLPTLSISPGLNVTVGEDTVLATLTEPSVINCPFTGDPAVATADPTQCYISFNSPPSGMTIDNGGSLPLMLGIIDTAGNYPITAEVFKHDGTVLQKIGQVSKTVTAACSAPAVISFNMPSLLPYEVPSYGSTYRAYSCNGALTGSITIKRNTTVVETLPLSNLGYGATASYAQAGSGLPAGNYTAELSLTGSYGTANKTTAFQVKTAPLPSLTVSPTTASQGETRVDVSLTPSTDTSCPLTTNQSEAEADSHKCFVALSTTLPDMSPGTDAGGLPTMAGYPATVGDYTVQASVSRWVNGTRYDSDFLTRTVKVNPVVPPVFAFTGKSSVYVGIEKASLIFKQDSGTTCSLFTDQPTAQTEAAKGKRACFVDFTGDTGLAKTLSLNQYKLEGALTTIGTQTLGYTVKRQFADGLTTELQTGSYDVTVNELPPPQITLKGGYKISEGKYYVPINQAITRATINAGVPTNAKMKIQLTDSQQTFERGGVMNGGSYWLSTPALGLLEERPVTLRVSWQDYPQVYNEQVITAVGGTESNMKLVIDAPLKTADTDLITVKVNVGKYTKTGVNYTPDTMGQWRIQILGQTNTQTIKAPITEMEDAVNGEATFQINPAGNLFMKLTAVAELVSNVEGLDSTLTSSTRYVEVVKGSPIEGAISAKTLDGPAPKTFTLNLDMTLDNRVALKEVSWEESTADGVTWTAIEKSNTIRHNIAMTAPGKVKSRAKMTNKNTLVESYTAPVEVWAYAMLDAQIVGSRHVAPGYPITLAAQLYREGVLTTDTVNEWTIEAPSGNSTQTGQTVTISEATEGKIYLTLRSRPADTRADDPNAWSAARSYVVVATPTRPSIYAKGPRDVETGKVYTYTGTVRPSWGSMESVHSTASEWQLPDGSTVSGQTLDWSPTTQDLTDKIPLIFRSWVNGFKETTTSETTVTYVPWEYVWPNWTVTLKQLTIQTPSDLILLVNHDRPDMNRRFEGLTYEWSFPSGVTGRQNDAFPNRAMAQALYAGEYDIQVTIRDNRGNQTTLTQHVTAQAAVPYTVTIKVGKSNYYDRAPMTITVRPTIYGGHPLDSVIGQSWFVDGQPVDEFANRSYMVKEILNAGNHTIRYTLNSKMGETATVDSPLFLVANQLPTCELVAKSNSYVVYAEATCKDVDGKVIGYSWEVNGQPIGSTSYRISFSKTATPQSANVTITAMDDAKELSIPVSINVAY